MADVRDRDDLEKRLARKLGKLQRAQMGRLLELLGDPPKLENVTADFWDDAGAEMIGALSPELESIFLMQAEQMLASVPIGVDWALVNTRAVDWARGYTFDLVSGINETSRRALQTAVSSYFDQGLTMGDLTGRISNLYGPVRAEMIAVTEVTRAAAQGEEAIGEELRKEGIEMVQTWATNRDDVVCPICNELDKKKRGDGWTEPPPAHPRCRCWINHELQKV